MPEKSVKEAEDLWPTGPEVLNTLEVAVQMAEEIGAPPAERWVARTLSDKGIASLYNARTYLEVGRIPAVEATDFQRRGLAGYYFNEIAILVPRQRLDTTVEGR